MTRDRLCLQTVATVGKKDGISCQDGFTLQVQLVHIRQKNQGNICKYGIKNRDENDGKI